MKLSLLFSRSFQALEKDRDAAVSFCSLSRDVNGMPIKPGPPTPEFHSYRIPRWIYVHHSAGSRVRAASVVGETSFRGRRRVHGLGKAFEEPS
jgi:hypothetical protein